MKFTLIATASVVALTRAARSLGETSQLMLCILKNNPEGMDAGDISYAFAQIPDTDVNLIQIKQNLKRLKQRGFLKVVGGGVKNDPLRYSLTESGTQATWDMYLEHDRTNLRMRSLLTGRTIPSSSPSHADIIPEEIRPIGPYCYLDGAAALKPAGLYYMADAVDENPTASEHSINDETRAHSGGP